MGLMLTRRSSSAVSKHFEVSTKTPYREILGDSPEEFYSRLLENVVLVEFVQIIYF